MRKWCINFYTIRSDFLSDWLSDFLSDWFSHILFQFLAEYLGYLFSLVIEFDLDLGFLNRFSSLVGIGRSARPRISDSSVGLLVWTICCRCLSWSSSSISRQFVNSFVSRMDLGRVPYMPQALPASGSSTTSALSLEKMTSQGRKARDPDQSTCLKYCWLTEQSQVQLLRQFLIYLGAKSRDWKVQKLTNDAKNLLCYNSWMQKLTLLYFLLTSSSPRPSWPSRPATASSWSAWEPGNRKESWSGQVQPATWSSQAPEIRHYFAFLQYIKIT